MTYIRDLTVIGIPLEVGWHPYSIILNFLWPSDAIWHQKSLPTLVQVMACCLTAPNHQLNQCWFIISEVQCQSPEGHFTNDKSEQPELIEWILQGFLLCPLPCSDRFRWGNSHGVLHRFIHISFPTFVGECRSTEFMLCFLSFFHFFFFFFQKKKKYLRVATRLKDRVALLQAKMEELQIERDHLKWV